MPLNTAAWITSRGARLEVGPAPYPVCGPGQVVVRAAAVAVNPLEWIIQVAGSLAYRWLEYPTVLGSDVAGVVVEVGAGVTRFCVGDRVLGHAVGTDKDVNSAAEGAFQTYTVVLERMACRIPESMPFEEAAVLPLAVSTAASGLFQTDLLGLQLPSATPQPTGMTLLVWGGSTSVGTNAIQLAVAAGYDVIATASPHNADYVRSLGAVIVVDYASPTAVAELVRAFEGRTAAGAIAFGTTAANGCIAVMGSVRGHRFVCTANPPVSFAELAGASRVGRASVVRRLITSNIALQLRARSHRVRIQYVFGTSLKANGVSDAVYRDFLPGALASGQYVPSPRPRVVGHGLAAVQDALDEQRRGVSATKLVVTLA